MILSHRTTFRWKSMTVSNRASITLHVVSFSFWITKNYIRVFLCCENMSDHVHVLARVFVFVCFCSCSSCCCCWRCCCCCCCCSCRRRRRCLCGYRPEPRRAGVFSSNCCVPSLPAFDMLRMLTCCKYLHVQMLSHVHLLGVGGDGVVY